MDPWGHGEGIQGLQAGLRVSMWPVGALQCPRRHGDDGGACRSATGCRRGGLGVLQLPTIKASRSILPLLARIRQNSSAMVVLRPWRACSARVQGSTVPGPSGLGEVVGVVVDVCVSVPCFEAAKGVDVGPLRWGDHVGGHGAHSDGEQRAVRGVTVGVEGERMAV